ncbi:hypothetical protein [Rhizobium phaseoli]|nr:hypothetical protein [Rhizobium phaseoli]
MTPGRGLIATGWASTAYGAFDETVVFCAEWDEDNKRYVEA